MSDIFDWPDELRGVTLRNFHLHSGNLQSSSFLIGEVSPFGPIVQRWKAGFTFPPRALADWQRVDGLIARLKGISGLLRACDPARLGPIFNKTAVATITTWDGGSTWDDGTGWVDGLLPSHISVDQAAIKGARSLIIKGLPVSSENVLKTGELFEIRPNGVPATHGHLYMLTSDVRTDATGKSAMTFEPGLRAAVAADDMVVLNNPKSVFRLASDDEGVMQVDIASIGRNGFSLIEVLPEK